MEETKKFNKNFTILRGETVNIDNGYLKITFTSHSHKTTFPGQVSPLIIHLEYEFENKKYEKSYYMHGNIPFIWRWNKFLFVIMDYKYDESMTMKIVYDDYTD